MWPCLSYLISVTVHSDLLWSSVFVTSRLNCNTLPDNWQIPAVFLVRRSSPRNFSPLRHRTVTVANRVPRFALSGILTVGGVIVTFNSGAGLWRARESAPGFGRAHRSTSPRLTSASARRTLGPENGATFVSGDPQSRGRKSDGQLACGAGKSGCVAEYGPARGDQVKGILLGHLDDAVLADRDVPAEEDLDRAKPRWRLDADVHRPGRVPFFGLPLAFQLFVLSSSAAAPRRRCESVRLAAGGRRIRTISHAKPAI